MSVRLEDTKGKLLPQWSPPLVGGMTQWVKRLDAVDVSAAMEPAAGGRDD